MLEKYGALVLGGICLMFGLREFWYFKKGWGIKPHVLNDPYYADEKPSPQKIEKLNLLIQAIVLFVFGVGLIILGVFNVLS